jgi:hypothetical protein
MLFYEEEFLDKLYQNCSNKLVLHRTGILCPQGIFIKEMKVDYFRLIYKKRNRWLKW